MGAERGAKRGEKRGKDHKKLLRVTAPGGGGENREARDHGGCTRATVFNMCSSAKKALTEEGRGKMD